MEILILLLPAVFYLLKLAVGFVIAVAVMYAIIPCLPRDF